jgi:hypothetical protein
VGGNRKDGKYMKFFSADAEKKLSTPDLELLRREIRQLDSRARSELAGRERRCAYCGDRIGSSVLGSVYCCAWHSHVDRGNESSAAKRIEFEGKRARRRIRIARKATAQKLASMEDLERPGYAQLEILSRNLRIRKILSEYTAITGRKLARSANSGATVDAAERQRPGGRGA